MEHQVDHCGCGSWEEMSRGAVKWMWAGPVATACYNEHLEFFMNGIVLKVIILTASRDDHDRK